MQLVIVDDGHLRLHIDAASQALAVDGDVFNPLQMLAASLALCTAAAIRTYVATARLALTDFSIDLRWSYAQQPYRIERYAMEIQIPPTIPAARLRAIQRAADACTVHNTLLHPPTIDTAVHLLPDDAVAPQLGND